MGREEKDGGNGIKVWECENLQVIYYDLHFGPQPKVLYFIYVPYYLSLVILTPRILKYLRVNDGMTCIAQCSFE